MQEAHFKLQEKNDQLTTQLETAAFDRAGNEWSSALSHLTSNSRDSTGEEMEARHNALMKEKDEKIYTLERDVWRHKKELNDVIKAQAYDTGHPDFQLGHEKVRPYPRQPINECQNAYRPPSQVRRTTRQSRFKYASLFTKTARVFAGVTKTHFLFFSHIRRRQPSLHRRRLLRRASIMALLIFLPLPRPVA